MASSSARPDGAARARRARGRSAKLVLLACAAFFGCQPAQTPPSSTGPMASAAPVSQSRCMVAAARLVRAARRPIQIDLYVTRGRDLETFGRDVETLLTQLAGVSGGRMTIASHAVTTTDTHTEAARDGLTLQSFVGAGGAEEGAPRGYFGIVVRYGGRTRSVDLQPRAPTGIAYWTLSALQSLTSIVDGVSKRIGVLTGHGEIGLFEANLAPYTMGAFSVQGVMIDNFPYYQFVEVNLKRGERAVDPSLEGLIITQPAEDLNDAELRLIDRFVTSGKSLAVFAGAANVAPSDSSMTAHLARHGLEKLLDGYGIELRHDVLLDFARSFWVEVEGTSGRKDALRLPQIPFAEDDDSTGRARAVRDDFQPTFALPRVAVPMASSIVLHPEKQPDARPMVVLRTTMRARRVGDEQVDLSPWHDWGSGGELGQFAVAAYLQGHVRPAFPSGENALENETARSRVFVVSSSQFLTNPFARAGNPPVSATGRPVPTEEQRRLLSIAGTYAKERITDVLLLVKNTLDWMVGYDELLPCRTETIGGK